MSALGQKQTFAAQQGMSALPPKADMCSATRDVRFVPKADMAYSPIDQAAQPKSKTPDLLSLECCRVRTLQGLRWRLPQCTQR